MGPEGLGSFGRLREFYNFDFLDGPVVVGGNVVLCGYVGIGSC